MLLISLMSITIRMATIISYINSRLIITVWRVCSGHSKIMVLVEPWWCLSHGLVLDTGVRGAHIMVLSRGRIVVLIPLLVVRWWRMYDGGLHDGHLSRLVSHLGAISTFVRGVLDHLCTTVRQLDSVLSLSGVSIVLLVVWEIVPRVLVQDRVRESVLLWNLQPRE